MIRKLLISQEQSMHSVRMRSVISTVIVGLMTAGLSAGCGGGGTTVPTGTVTGEVKKMNGEPLSKVMVVFYPAKGPSVVTRTDESGAFTASVPLGTAKVGIVESGEASSTDNSPGAAIAPPAKPKIKPQFASPDSSGLTVEVTKQQKEKAVFVVE